MLDRWQCMICGYVHEGPTPPESCPLCGAPFTAFEREEESPEVRFRGVERVQERPCGYRYVIIGNSAAGRSAARAIRALDADGEVTILSEETVPFYVRPMLPDFIGGMARQDFFAAGSHFEEEGLTIRLGNRVERLDVAAREVILSSGTRLPFDALLLATGSVPIQIPWPGSEAEGIAYFRTFADAERIALLAGLAKHAVVVGGGLLGLEFVRAFRAAGLQVTHLIRECHIGSPLLDEQAGSLLQSALEGMGVNLAFEEEVKSFEVCEGKVCGLYTSRERFLACDLVGVAVGVRPRIELAQTAGLAVDRGILVDRSFQTSVPGIYAAGDVAQAFDRIWGQPRVNTSWRNSRQQGELAGLAMAGGAVHYPGAVAANFQLTAGIPFGAIGITNPPLSEEWEVEVHVDFQAGTYRKTVRRKGTLVGATLLGDLREAGDLEQQICQGGSFDEKVSVAEAF